MSIKLRPKLFFLLVALVVCDLAGGQTRSTNYDESKVGSYTLPDPLTFSNGKPVRNARDWKRRRAELIELFAKNVYGHSPKPPKRLSFEVFETSKTALGGKAIRKQVTIYFSDKKDGPKEDMLIYFPAGAKKPVPMILALNFFGNQSVINDPGVKLPTIWDWKTHEKQQATEESRGHDKEFEVKRSWLADTALRPSTTRASIGILKADTLRAFARCFSKQSRLSLSPMTGEPLEHGPTA